MRTEGTGSKAGREAGREEGEWWRRNAMEELGGGSEGDGGIRGEGEDGG